MSERIEGDFTFDNPIYHVDGNEYRLLNSKGIPDTININKDTKEFMLLDAKYYLVRIVKGEIKEVPMYKDISKQMYYFDMLCDYGLTPEDGANAFVMPVHDLYGESGIKLDEGQWVQIHRIC